MESSFFIPFPVAITTIPKDEWQHPSVRGITFTPEGHTLAGGAKSALF